MLPDPSVSERSKARAFTAGRDRPRAALEIELLLFRTSAGLTGRASVIPDCQVTIWFELASRLVYADICFRATLKTLRSSNNFLCSATPARAISRHVRVSTHTRPKADVTIVDHRFR
jgi:hypothetical protein